MERRRMRTVGSCVDHAVTEASEEWFRRHGGMREREEAFANGISSIDSSAQLKKGGRLEVHVIVVAVKKRENLTEYRRYQRDGSKGYLEQ